MNGVGASSSSGILSSVLWLRGPALSTRLQYPLKALLTVDTMSYDGFSENEARAVPTQGAGGPGKQAQHSCVERYCSANRPRSLPGSGACLDLSIRLFLTLDLTIS